MVTALLDPDDVVETLGAYLKAAGWTYSQGRKGLGWSTKRLGTDKRKKTLLTVRVGVKGRRDGWGKGEISVMLYKMSLADVPSWGTDPYRNPYRKLCRELVADFQPDLSSSAMINFTGGLEPDEAACMQDYLKTSLEPWIQNGEAVAAQVEMLHEEFHKDPADRCVAL